MFGFDRVASCGVPDGQIAHMGQVRDGERMQVMLVEICLKWVHKSLSLPL
jgi:hypothetical protein